MFLSNAFMACYKNIFTSVRKISSAYAMSVFFGKNILSDFILSKFALYENCIRWFSARYKRQSSQIRLCIVEVLYFAIHTILFVVCVRHAQYSCFNSRFRSYYTTKTCPFDITSNIHCHALYYVCAVYISVQSVSSHLYSFNSEIMFIWIVKHSYDSTNCDSAFCFRFQFVLSFSASSSLVLFLFFIFFISTWLEHFIETE